MPATSRESQNHRCGNVRLAALPSHRFKLVQLLQNGVEFLYFRLTRANDNNFSSSSISGFTRRLNSHFNVSSNYHVIPSVCIHHQSRSSERRGCSVLCSTIPIDMLRMSSPRRFTSCARLLCLGFVVQTSAARAELAQLPLSVAISCGSNSRSLGLLLTCPHCALLRPYAPFAAVVSPHRMTSGVKANIVTSPWTTVACADGSMCSAQHRRSPLASATAHARSLTATE